MSGQNKKIILIMTNVILIGFYLFIIGYIAHEYTTYSSNYSQIQAEYINTLNLEIENLIKDPYKIDSDALFKLREKKPFDLILQTNDKILFQSINLQRNTSYMNSINSEIVAYQHQGYSNNNEVMKWSIIYKLSASQYTEMFLFQQNILFSIMFLVLLTFIYVIQFFLFKPINKLVKSIEKANEKGYIMFEVEEDDNLNKNINFFMDNLKQQIKTFNQDYTDLEIQLQYEKELLNNSFLVSKALIHELKSPVYALMLENQLFEKNHQSNPEVSELIHMNEKRIDSILQELNMTLRVMNDDYEQLTVSERFNVVSIIQQSIKLFQSMIDSNDLYLDLVVTKDLVVTQKMIYFKLLIHNMLSNTFQYASQGTDILIETYIDNENLIIEVTNKLSDENLSKMQLSKNMFYDIPNIKYSSGHGLFLIKTLAQLMGGTQDIHNKEGYVIVSVTIPKENLS